MSQHPSQGVVPASPGRSTFDPSQGVVPASPGRSTALVTGGTAGIGAAFAAQLAREGSDLVLVARTESRLTDKATELSERYGIAVETIAADLSTAHGLGRVEARVADAGAPIHLLVNNAGFGLAEDFLDSDVAAEEEMLAVNVRAVLRLTHAALPAMIERGSGGIINVSSMAGSVPTATGATYAASKAWVTAFTESLSMLVAGKGVALTALCPGFTRTEFHDRVGVSRGGVPELLWLDADDVVAAGLRDHRRGAVISVPGVQYKASVIGSRLVPRSVLRWVSARVTAGI
ncbi:MAG: SDR family oxidoreductase [Geodermatophilaceae bacterium]|nr:SDR family oxidoreductase [Geodermatophilaceae bacterium]